MSQLIKKEVTPLVSETAMALLEELAEECGDLQTLLAKLYDPSLSVGEVEDLLVKLTGSISHLHVHAVGLDDVVTRELEQLPEE